MQYIHFSWYTVLPQVQGRCTSCWQQLACLAPGPRACTWPSQVRQLFPLRAACVTLFWPQVAHGDVQQRLRICCAMKHGKLPLGSMVHSHMWLSGMPGLSTSLNLHIPGPFTFLDPSHSSTVHIPHHTSSVGEGVGELGGELSSGELCEGGGALWGSSTDLDARGSDAAAVQVRFRQFLHAV